MSTTTTKKQRPYHVRLAIHRLRVNIKSLAAEARFNRHESYRTRDAGVKAELHYHRVTRLRSESRLAHLALAYIRGRTYRSVEAKTRNRLWPGDLQRKLQRFIQVHPEDVKKWLDA